jgi:hypothetical protein
MRGDAFAAFWPATWRIGCEGAMTGRIIRLRGDGHQDVQALLPWYVAGGLDDAEQALVEAHVAACAECQAELRDERLLADAVADLPYVDVGSPAAVAQGWDSMKRRIERERRKPAPIAALRGWTDGAWREAGRQSRVAAPWLRWTVAAQFCLLLALGAAMTLSARPVRYVALGAAPTAAAGDVVVMFRPDTPERDLRRMLQSSGARLVDGPTAADAYLLHVAPAERAAALATLRRQPDVALAEPVDAGGPP